ncbi:MAG: DUF6029 family protein [Bacteroidia bacterium]|nr:DUF6029 family protein [Bacteroidia bacterium]
MNKWQVLFSVIFISSGLTSFSQNSKLPPPRISGSLQSDVQYLITDTIIGATAPRERILSNTFLQVTYDQGPFSAGLRYEAYLNPVLGFDERYEGQGIPYRFFSYQGDRLDLTIGNIYDQFGNGLIFRAYQEWNLGIDNSIDGIHLRFRPRKGLEVKGILGTQRKFFDRSESIIRGADIEASLNELFPKFMGEKINLSIGGSVLNRFLEDTDVVLQLPENVSAVSGRAKLYVGNFIFNGEYAYKINDPFGLNNFVYNPGHAFFFNASYSRKGLGIDFNLKRIDNFDFRSERNISLQELTLNFLPPGTKIQTYRLPTLYPYATQFNGELGFQATLYYKIPRKTPLGGKYGTKIQVNFSRYHAPDTTFIEPNFRYETNLLGDPQNLYFQDFNIEINRRWTKKFRTIFTYIWLNYNKDIIEFGTPAAGFGIVESHIFVLEGQYKINKKLAFRSEIQHMGTQQDLGSWAMVLGELSVSPNWYFTLFDEYNYGNPDPALRIHYYNASVAYAFGSNRIGISYSRQRRGLLCVGGICREVPASNGLNMTLTSTW